MKKALLFYGLSMTLLFACQNKSNQAESQNAAASLAQDSQQVIQQHDERDAYTPAVSLNKGQKWQANAETSEGISRMIGLLEAFSKEPKIEEYRTLKIKLEKEFNAILQKCTMKGEAHNQLHHYLLPLKDSIEKLGGNSTEASGEALDDLRRHLKEYGQYFQ